MLKILCKRGSVSSRVISEKTGVPRTYWQGNVATPRGATVLINWGVYGSVRDRFMGKYPYARDLSVVNGRWPGNKYNVIITAANKNIPVPLSDRNIGQRHWTNTHWIYKPNYSAGGEGIFRITNETAHDCDWSRGYAQQEVLNRRYEVRVAAFTWLPQEEWGCWKKVCDDASQLCWNHHQGGRFQRVEQPLRHGLFQRCYQHSLRLLNELGLQFGAIDFIVDSEGTERFLEINTQPGFTENYGADLYANAISKLNALSLDEILSHINGANTGGEEVSLPTEEPREEVDARLSDGATRVSDTYLVNWFREILQVTTKDHLRQILDRV